MPIDLALTLQVVTTLTVVGGFIFGAVNLRDYSRARDQRAALQAVSVIAVEMSSAVRRVFTMTDRPFLDTVGGAIRAGWPLLRPWVEAHRARSGNQYLDEWFEWLYLQLDRYLNKKTAPAALAHLDWRP